MRYSGVSVGYALGSILGGAFAATIAQWLVATWGRSWLVGAYVVVLCTISFVAVSRGEDPKGVDLHDGELHAERLRAHPELAGRDPGALRRSADASIEDGVPSSGTVIDVAAMPHARPPCFEAMLLGHSLDASPPIGYEHGRSG